MSSEESSFKQGGDKDRVNAEIRGEVEDLIGRILDGSSVWDRLLFFPHLSFSRGSNGQKNHVDQEISIKSLQKSMGRLKKLQMSLPGCMLAWVVLCAAHLSISFLVKGSESIGLIILSFAMVAVMAIATCLSFFSQNTWRSSTMNALLLMSFLFVFATLISRLITIPDVSILYKIALLRIVMLTPVMVFDHPIVTGVLALSGDLGIGLILGLHNSHTEEVARMNLTQIMFCLVSYFLAFSLSVLLTLARTKIRTKISGTFEKLSEIVLIQLSMVSHLHGIPNYFLRMEKVEPLPTNFVAPALPMVTTGRELPTPRDEQSLISSVRRVQPSRMRMLSLSLQNRVITQNSSRTYGHVRLSTTGLGIKEPAKTGFKVMTSSSNRNILDTFEEIIKNTYFTSASVLTVERLLTDQEVRMTEFESTIEKFKEYLSDTSETKPFHPLEEFWLDLGDRILSRYDCLLKLENLSYKNPLDSSYTSKSMLIYSIGKRSEDTRCLYIKIRKEIGGQLSGPQPSIRLNKKRSADKSDRHPSGISQIIPVIKKGNTLGGASSISVRMPESKFSNIGDENNLSPRNEWPDFEGDGEGMPSSIYRVKPATHKTSIVSQAPSSHFSKIVHFIESSASKRGDDRSKFQYPDDKSLSTPKNVLVASPPDRPLSRRYANQNKLSPRALITPAPTIKEDSPLANQSMEELISMVVHDMRSPLMCIQGNMELIVFEMKENPAFTSVEPLIKASMAASSLLETLVSDVLDSARISKGIFKITAEDMDLEETINECIETLKIAANSRDNVLACEFNCGSNIIVSDKQRIKQVLLNFMSNSIKFTSNGKITIKAFDTLDTIRIAIEDNGKGIKKENIPKLFEKFSSDRDVRSNAKGIGLGLFICKSIIETLGPKKDISVTSEPNVRTCITFEIFKDVKRGSTNTITIGRNTMDGSRTKLKSETISAPSSTRGLHRGRRRKSFDIFDMNNQGVFETKSIIEVRRRTINRNREKELSRYSPSSSIVVNNPSVVYPEERILRENESTVRNYPSVSLVKKPTLPVEASTSYRPIGMVEEEDYDNNEESKLEGFMDTPLRIQTTQLLILDDEPAVSELLRMFTEQLSKQDDYRLEVVEVECVQDAKALAELRRFDIIVTDYNLPDGFGPDFVKHVVEKRKAAGIKLPLTVLITGEDPHCDEVQRISHLYKEILRKPVGMALWSKTLKRLMAELTLSVPLQNLKEPRG